MNTFKVGDIVGRKSYGSDIYFKISDIVVKPGQKPVYILRGLIYRIEADCCEDDLVKLDTRKVRSVVRREMFLARRRMLLHLYLYRRYMLRRFRARPGKILHVDADREYLDMCVEHYKESNINPVTALASESRQPDIIGELLEQHKPDILVVTGHDAIKKDVDDLYSLDSYRNSKYFIESVKEARKYEPNFDRLCIFAGACQSYYEAIMEAGANFASSPGRVLINALDPAFVSEKVALTDYRMIVTPREIAQITVSGSEGIGGINTRGHLK